jgi:hypothetical protein
MRDELPDDAVLRRYLLGELPEGEEAEIEALLLENDELFERSEAMEGDLLDDYESGHLTAAQRKRVEGWLEASEDLRVRHQILRRMRETRPNVVPFPKRRQVLWLAAAAVLALVAGLFWLRAHRGIQTEPRQAHELPQPAPPASHTQPQRPPAPAPDLAQKEPGKRPHGEGNKDLRDLGNAASVLAATVLDISLEVRRDVEGEIQKVALGRDARERKLRFFFDFPPDTERFKLTLRDAKGTEVGSWNEVRVRAVKDDRALVVTVPSEKLPPGRYVVQAEPIAPGPDDVPIELGFEVVASRK